MKKIKRARRIKKLIILADLLSRKNNNIHSELLQPNIHGKSYSAYDQNITGHSY